MSIGNLSKSLGRKKSFRIDPERYALLKNRWKRYFRHHDISLSRRSVIDHLYELPIEPNTVLLCGLGRNVNGSLRYLLDVLNHDSRFEGYRIFVRTTAEQTDDLVNDIIKEEGWTRTSTVPKKYDRMMETCQYLLTESWFPYQYTKRPGQTLINIWHGTPLKHLGALISGDKCHVNAQIQKNFLSSDYLLYPNDFTKDVMLRSYQIEHLLAAKALMMGYPRTAGILKVTDEEKAELRSVAAPNGEKIYAYMPTFREYQDDDEFIERITPVLSYLDEKLTDGQILYVNLHHYHHRNNYLDVDSFKHIKKFPDKIDTYRLLSITDALISDYSSIFFDFLITGKKVILYVEDLDEYLQHQGLNLDIRQLPLALAFSKEELLGEINSEQKPDGSPDEQNPDGVANEQNPDVIDIRDLYKYDRKDNPEKLCGLFEGSETGLDLREIPDADVPTVLMYSEGFVSEAETEVIRELALRQSEKPSGENASYSKPSGENASYSKPSGENAYEIYVGCDEKITEEHKKNAYPWLHDVRVVASLSSQPLSSVGAPLKELYLNKKISFGRAMPYLSHEYALTYQRMYGNAKIDMIAVMDCCEPETLIGIALSPVKHKVLFISKAAANEVRRGNRFLKDALRFSVDYYDIIATLDKDDAKYIRSILPMFKRNRLVTVDGAEETDEIFRTVLR